MANCLTGESGFDQFTRNSDESPENGASIENLIYIFVYLSIRTLSDGG